MLFLLYSYVSADKFNKKMEFLLNSVLDDEVSCKSYLFITVKVNDTFLFHFSHLETQ